MAVFRKKYTELLISPNVLYEVVRTMKDKMRGSLKLFLISTH